MLYDLCLFHAFATTTSVTFVENHHCWCRDKIRCQCTAFHYSTWRQSSSLFFLTVVFRLFISSSIQVFFKWMAMSFCASSFCLVFNSLSHASLLYSFWWWYFCFFWFFDPLDMVHILDLQPASSFDSVFCDF